MKLRIQHETIYRYAAPATQSVQMLKLTPRLEQRQHTLSWEMSAPGRRTRQIDAHGNVTHLLSIDELHDQIRVVVSGVVDLDSGTMIADPGPLSPLVYVAATPLTASDAAIAALCQRHRASTNLRAQLEALVDDVCTTIKYQPGTTTVTDTAASALARGEGVCQDQAHVFLACARLLKIPARYVSGYLHTGDGQDIASHAWADAWLGDSVGWLGLDITHRRCVDERYCRLAVGRDYLDAAPVRGIRRGGGGETLEVNVTVSTEQ
jgi:transglutaminase-like putative cysteine protease